MLHLCQAFAGFGLSLLPLNIGKPPIIVLNDAVGSDLQQRLFSPES
jgi:hypothetical protein